MAPPSRVTVAMVVFAAAFACLAPMGARGLGSDHAGVIRDWFEDDFVSFFDPSAGTNDDDKDDGDAEVPEIPAAEAEAAVRSMSRAEGNDNAAAAPAGVGADPLTTYFQSEGSGAVDRFREADPYAVGAQPDPAQTPGAAEGDPSPSLDAMQQTALDLHNEYRAKHHAPPLVWSAEVADSAQRWADNCRFMHSHGTGLGENLAMGHNDIGAAIKDWYEEVHMYSFDIPTWSMATGHFTQVSQSPAGRIPPHPTFAPSACTHC